VKAKTLGALFLTPFVTVIDWQALVSWSPWFVVVLGIPVIGIAMLVVARVKQRPRIMNFGVAMLLSGLIGAPLAIYLNRQQTDTNTALGERVAAALDKHWVAHGSYPNLLTELVPDYLEKAPRPSIGAFASTPFWYTPSDQQGDFVLGYEAIRGVALMRSKGKWSALPVPW
jgi:hypothetical protein